jgi:hypothetical protein
VMILAPSFGFCALRTVHYPPLVECFSNYGQTPPAEGRKRFVPAPGKTSLSLLFLKRHEKASLSSCF